ncbi:GAF domain-containing sensor histidine kinase [Actinoplanes sp. HUAS TT8]|uniref:GAF domain-containing sensor histidine kinase n=1 Tax=Actinoplanes sp. HUAS TT8 TaxID=3447453 RepID=UPI003F521D49
MISGTAVTGSSALTAPLPDPHHTAFAGMPEVLELATEACELPMAAIAILNTSGYAVTRGLPAATALPPLTPSLDLTATTMIGDITADPRLRDHPLVTGPLQIRFLGVVPLYAANQAIGALCVFDRKPRHRGIERTQRLLTHIAGRIDTETRLMAASPLPANTNHDQVIADISHELRTPLTSICGNLELLTDTPGAITPGVQRWTDAINRNTARLCRTVDNLLRIIGPDSAQPTGRQQPVDLAAIVSSAARSINDPTRRLRADLPDDPVPVTADPQQLQIAVGHLLHNAFHFTGHDTPITVTVTGNPQPTITVSDRGPGLDPHELAQLGAPFVRGSQARTDQTPGLGLGLAITHRIITAHAGTLHLRNHPDTGLTAQIMLPPAPDRAGEHDASRGQPASI